MGNRAGERLDCFKCRHFYVTWDEFFPRGCKALSFKSRELPSAVVLKSSGLDCQMYEPRDKKSKKST
ncbi:MAG: uracil-DNA glycosylase [Deltaproteobacteria bacterium]|nr:uracil-DNA glycosylase [Deltaproteobacteria bacterium]